MSEPVTMDTTVTMYTTQWCAFCRRLKSQLTRDGIEVAEVDIERDEAAASFVISVNGGNMTVPDRCILRRDGDDEPIGGPGQGKAARARRELMSGRHDRSNADARVRAGVLCCPQTAPRHRPRTPQARKVQASAV